MSEQAPNPNDVPAGVGLVLVGLFLVIVGIGVATVVVPEVRDDSTRTRDASVDEPQ